MKTIRRRTAEEILDELREKSHSYTPEWRFDMQMPDIGGALACVYAFMQSRLDRKYAQLPEKLRIDFFNCLNTSMKTAAPARGYVAFGLSGEDTEGSFLPAGTALRTDVTDENGEAVPLELTEDVFVVPDTLAAIYETRGSKDYIGQIYQEGEEDISGGFPLFGMSRDNLERHVFRLSHPYLFRLDGYGSIGLSFYDKKGNPLPESIVSRLADRGAARFYYETGEEGGEEELGRVVYRNGKLWINKTASQAAWAETEHFGILSRWLCCEIMDIRGLENFAPARIDMTAECQGALLDVICAAGTDQPLQEPCLPFGERFAVYDDVYFGAADALSKKGAKIELSFQEEFVRIPITDPKDGDGFAWKLIMPKEQFRPEKEYDITIEEVIWEYYNGSGWARLFPGNECTDTFSVSRGSERQHRKISFVCPEDLSPVLAGSGENYYIRARVLKVNNAYKTMGYYVTPIISDASISWVCAGENTEPEYLTAANHLEEELINVRRVRREERLLTPVKAAEDNRPAIYLGFRSVPRKGPVRILWEVEQTMQEDQPEIVWEYLKDGGWEPLMPLDGTENFRMTGLLTYGGIPDAALRRLFGQEYYWIRAVQTESTAGHKTAPVVRGWYMNGAGAVTLRHGFSEYWTLENWETGARIQLLNRHIHHLELWVREDERLSREETAKLLAEGRYREVLDDNGDRSFAWIRWEQTDNLLRHDPGERVYMLDENEGILSFGGGAAGRVPAPGITDGIHALYSIGGGKLCSLPVDTVSGLELSEGFVSEIYNPLPFTGGCDRETVSGAIRRASAENRHHFRAVTEEDFEEMAMSASGSIRKARCLSGIDEEGAAVPGAVTLVLLTDDYTDRGAGFERLKKNLYEWFRDKLPASFAAGQGFKIRRAEIVEIELHAEAVIKDYQKIYRIQKELQEKLDKFLDPVTGNFDGRGWEIGMLPERSQMETIIRTQEGIDSLRNCQVFARMISRTGRPAVSYEMVKNAPFVLPVSGSHQFRLGRKNSREA